MTNTPIEAGLTVEGLAEHGAQAFEHAKHLRVELQALAMDEHAALSWENTFAKLDEIREALSSISGIAGLMAVTHPDAAMRAAAEAWDPQITNFNTDFFMDAQLAKLFERAASAINPLSGPHARFVEDTLREYRRNGLHLQPAEQEHLKKMNEELTRLARNLNATSRRRRFISRWTKKISMVCRKRIF